MNKKFVIDKLYIKLLFISICPRYVVVNDQNFEMAKSVNMIETKLNNKKDSSES